MTTKSISLTPFMLSEYCRDHAPDFARHGMRGYVLNFLVQMVTLKGEDCGTCFPSIAYIARKIGRSPRQVQRYIRELEEGGVVERMVRWCAKGGGQTSNRYRLRGLMAWAAKRVTPPPDKRVRQTPTGKKYNPARGGKSDFMKMQAARKRPVQASAPVAGAGYAEKRLSGVLSDPTPSSAPKRGLSVEQIEEARTKCDPVRWSKLLIEAGMDGATGVDIELGAARRWRADAIMARVPLVA